MADQSQVDNTGNYYSINVPASDMQTYFRLGDPDPLVENNLSTTPNSVAGVSGTTYGSGILLYTQGDYQQVTPSFTNWSGDSLTAVKDGKFLVQASYTATNVPFTYNYGLQAQFNSTVGNVSNFVTGNQLAYWVGNSASTGYGGLLWSNLGLTQNVFAGQIVNVINNNIDVQGIGEAKVQTNFEVVTSNGIELIVTPGATASATAMAGRIRSVLTVLSAIIAGGLAVTSTGITGLTGDLTDDPTKLRKVMASSAAELATATGVIALLQAAVASAGAAVKAAAGLALAAPGNKIIVSDEAIIMNVGAATRLMLTANGVYVTGVEFATSANASVTTSAAAIANWPP